MLCQVLRLRWKTAARTSSHVATCNHMQPLAATCPAATCSHLQPLAATCSHLQPLAATCSFLQPLAATCSHWQVAASGCFFENQIAHLLRPQWTIALKCSLNILHHITSVIFYWTLHPCLQKQGPFGCEEGCRITSLAFAPRMRCFKSEHFTHSLVRSAKSSSELCRCAGQLRSWCHGKDSQTHKHNHSFAQEHYMARSAGFYPIGFSGLATANAWKKIEQRNHIFDHLCSCSALHLLFCKSVWRRIGFPSKGLHGIDLCELLVPWSRFCSFGVSCDDFLVQAQIMTKPLEMDVSMKIWRLNIWNHEKKSWPVLQNPDHSP